MTNAAGAGFVELGAGAMIGMIGVIREKKKGPRGVTIRARMSNHLNQCSHSKGLRGV